MRNLIQTRPHPLLYAITDRLMLPSDNRGQEVGVLIEFIKRALAAGIDMIQIRERGLSTRDLLSISDAAKEAARKEDACILINDRADVAACAGIGVHLTTRSINPAVARNAFGEGLLIGASTHSLDEAQAAAQSGADFVVFGPVFDTESKKHYGPPVGLEALRIVRRSVAIPVLALGGINTSNFREALAAGASGIAGISLFAKADDLNSLAREIKFSSGASPS